MFEIEFEGSMDHFNQVMDAIVDAGAVLKWVYIDENRNTAVFRIASPREKQGEFLLRIAYATGPTEVSVVEKTDSGMAVHDAFLATFDTPSGVYPVAIILEYTEDKFHPRKITVATSSSAPKDLLDAVMSLTFGRVDMSSSSVVGRTVRGDTMMLYLESTVPTGKSYPVLMG